MLFSCVGVSIRMRRQKLIIIAELLYSAGPVALHNCHSTFLEENHVFPEKGQGLNPASEVYLVEWIFVYNNRLAPLELHWQFLLELLPL